MKKELVVKDNVLIEASYNLDLVEQRLILLAIIEARKAEKGLMLTTRYQSMLKAISINLAYIEMVLIKL